jgi:hypothetical protein
MSVFRKSRSDRVKELVKGAAAYTDELVRDERLRSDLRSALGHAVVATKRVGEDSGLSGFAARLESDRKLRNDLRSLLDDLDSAGRRVRRKRGHGVRNTLLIIGGAGVTLAAIPNTRRWVASHLLVAENGAPAMATPV